MTDTEEDFIVDIYSKRAARQYSESIDVYQYDEIPEYVRNQIVMVLIDRYYSKSYIHKITNAICHILAEEYGDYKLIEVSRSPDVLRRHYDNVEYTGKIAIFLRNSPVEKFMDAIELLLRDLHQYIQDNETPKLINTVNRRFREAAIGYQFENGQIIRIDNTYVHTEITKPALQLLTHPDFATANEEFLAAHSHYRRDEYDDCILDCNKALESTVKIILTQRGIEPKDTLKKNIPILLENNIIPSYLQTEFCALAKLLGQDICVIRNQVAGHGKGIGENKATHELAEYALHLTACNIVFLIKQHKQ